jgi:hypothetical protein
MNCQIEDMLAVNQLPSDPIAVPGGSVSKSVHHGFQTFIQFSNFWTRLKISDFYELC